MNEDEGLKRCIPALHHAFWDWGRDRGRCLWWCRGGDYLFVELQ